MSNFLEGNYTLNGSIFSLSESLNEESPNRCTSGTRQLFVLITLPSIPGFMFKSVTLESDKKHISLIESYYRIN